MISVYISEIILSRGRTSGKLCFCVSYDVSSVCRNNGNETSRCLCWMPPLFPPGALLSPNYFSLVVFLLFFAAGHSTWKVGVTCSLVSTVLSVARGDFSSRDIYVASADLDLPRRQNMVSSNLVRKSGTKTGRRRYHSRMGVGKSGKLAGRSQRRGQRGALNIMVFGSIALASDKRVEDREGKEVLKNGGESHAFACFLRCVL